MQKRLSWVGVLLTAVVVVLTAGVAINAGAPQPAGRRVRDTPSPYVAGSREAPPNCDGYCTEQTACEDACRYGTDMTCGQYAQYAQGATCVSCGSACGYTTPCDLQCLEDQTLTTCGGAEYDCGHESVPPAQNCSSVCTTDEFFCNTPCWNGSSYSPSTCGAEGYCEAPCYREASDYSGVVEPYFPRWDLELQEWVSDCYAWIADFEWDPCQSQPIRNLWCSMTFLGTEPANACCQTYGWIYGCDNSYGC